VAASRATEEAEAVLEAARSLLTIVARSMESALERVTLPQYRVLVVLCEYGPQRSGALADLVGVHQSTLTRTADRLVALGLIRRDTSPESRREVLIELTPKGRSLVVDVMRARRAAVQQLLRDLSARERSRITVGMALFARSAGEPETSDIVTLGM
jgi:DNA-binding MarR family transcriptional regulator